MHTHFLIVRVTCFKYFSVHAILEEDISKTYVVSDLTMGVVPERSPVVESILTHDGKVPDGLLEVV